MAEIFSSLENSPAGHKYTRDVRSGYRERSLIQKRIILAVPARKGDLQERPTPRKRKGSHASFIYTKVEVATPLFHRHHTIVAAQSQRSMPASGSMCGCDHSFFVRAAPASHTLCHKNKEYIKKDRKPLVDASSWRGVRGSMLQLQLLYIYIMSRNCGTWHWWANKEYNKKNRKPLVDALSCGAGASEVPTSDIMCLVLHLVLIRDCISTDKIASRLGLP